MKVTPLLERLESVERSNIAGIMKVLDSMVKCFLLDDDKFYAYGEIKNALTMHGFEVIASGSFRFGVRHSSAGEKVVFKVPYNKEALGMGKTEYDFYQRVTDIERPFLAECVHMGKYVVAMEYIEGSNYVKHTANKDKRFMAKNIPKSIQDFNHNTVITKEYEDATHANIIFSEERGYGVLVDYSLLPWS